MKTEDFNYELPEVLIAQNPLEKRSDSRLLVIDKATQTCSHQSFTDIINYLNKGDVLVLNNTKVIPARLIGAKIDTKAQIEILLLKNISNNEWECLARPTKRLKVGSLISFGEQLTAQVTAKYKAGIIHVNLVYQGNLYQILDNIGTMPLPPYIHQKLTDQSRYQTVYAKYFGSAAAPTAGFHFTEELLNNIAKKGIIITYVTLHVGLGTFRPVQVADIKDHEMHEEYYEMNDETAQILNNAKAKRKQIVAVGTTTTRTLETIINEHQQFIATQGTTKIFIYPGYQFKAITSLITNFHLPKSTLLMLVSAFAGRELILAAYQEAIKLKYRFYSFGDAMLIEGADYEN